MPVMQKIRLLRYARYDEKSGPSLWGSAATAAIYSGLHNLRTEQAKLFILDIKMNEVNINKFILW